MSRKGRKRWCLSWRTPPMRAPAFWYFTTLREALDAIGRIQSSATTKILGVTR